MEKREPSCNGARKPRLADTIAEELETDQAMQMIEDIVAFYRDTAKKNERIGAMLDRNGVDELKKAVCD
jgi:NAD(P)H-nitrite reductase large subunit